MLRRLPRQAKLFDQRLEVPFIQSPAPDRAAMNRFADLGDAGGPDRPLRLVEGQTARVPLQSAELHDPSRLSFKIIGNLFVPNLEHHAFGERGPPMSHQRIVSAIIASEFPEIVAP